MTRQGKTKSEIALSIWRQWLKSKGMDVPDEVLANKRGMSARAFHNHKNQVSTLLRQAKDSLAEVEKTTIQGNLKKIMPIIFSELSKNAAICIAIRKKLGGRDNSAKNSDSDGRSAKVRSGV